MNLEDLAKKTISEVSSMMEKQRKQSEILKEQIQKTEIKDELVSIPYEEFQEKQELEHTISLIKPQEEQIIQDENLKETLVQDENITTKIQTLKEDIFLQALRERILVLFEGLNNTKKDQIENRLNLTINFLEFLLANIEDKLKK